MRGLSRVAIASLAVAAASPVPTADARITNCGRVSDTHYSFRVTAHGTKAPSCRTARRVARRAVAGRLDRPRPVPGWSCTADHYYDGPWAFLCIRRRTHGQVSIDHFRRL
jgi:hypothetical protein